MIVNSLLYHSERNEAEPKNETSLILARRLALIVGRLCETARGLTQTPYKQTAASNILV